MLVSLDKLIMMYFKGAPSNVDPRIRHQQVTLTLEKNLHFQESQTYNQSLHSLLC